MLASPRAAIYTIRLKEVYAYRLNLLVWLLNPTLQLILLATVWRAVYDGRSSIDGVSLTAMTTYVSLSTLHSLLLRDDAIQWVEQRVRTGVIAMDLLRPIAVREQVMWGQLAQVTTRLGTVVMMFPVALLFSGFTATSAGGLYLLSTTMGWLISCFINQLLSAISFWTLELGGLTFLFFVVNAFLSGAAVPLWFMPDWLAGALQLLPFQATVYTPVSIYVGQLTGTAAWQAVGVQALWLIGLASLTTLVWRRALRRVVVQGG
jgi:ABC-2 type transport system permease protein